MRFIHAILSVKPEKVDLYEKTFLELKAKIIENEPGCHVFELCRDPDVPNGYRIFEAYEDAETIQAHISTDYYQTAARTFIECIAGDHMEEIDRRGLTGRAMYDLVTTLKMERFDTI